MTSGCAAAPKYTYVTVSPHQLAPLLPFFPPLQNLWPSSERWRPLRISTSFTPSVPNVCVFLFFFPPFSSCATILRYLGPRARSLFACKRRVADPGALLASLTLPSCLLDCATVSTLLLLGSRSPSGEPVCFFVLVSECCLSARICGKPNLRAAGRVAQRRAAQW